MELVVLTWQTVLIMWGYGKMKQKKLSIILTLFFIFCMVMSSVSALTRYTGEPGLPYLIYGSGLHADGRIQITNEATGYSITVYSSSHGYWQQDTGNWLTNNPGRKPVVKVMPGIYLGDVIKLQILDGCSDDDVCTKTFNAGSEGYEASAQIDFIITGEVPTPPSSPSSGGGSRRSSNDESGAGSGIKWDCGEWSACFKLGQQERTCTDTRLNTRLESQECVYEEPVKEPIVVPVDDPEKEPEPPKPVVRPPIVPGSDEDDGITGIIIAAMTIVIAGLGALWSYYKNTDLKGKYRWIPGMKGILNKKLEQYKDAVLEGDKEKIDKLGKTLLKYSKTITEKYLNILLKK